MNLWTPPIIYILREFWSILPKLVLISKRLLALVLCILWILLVGDFKELIHCLKYMKSIQDIGFILKEPNRDLILKCYVNPSYLTHPDSKSHQGYCLSYGYIGSLFSKTSMQQLISTSSKRSSCFANSYCWHHFCCELCKELRRPIMLLAIIFEDNGAVIALSRELTPRAKRCKHYLMAISWKSYLTSVNPWCGKQGRYPYENHYWQGVQERGWRPFRLQDWYCFWGGWNC